MYVHGILFVYLLIDFARELIVNVVINQKRFLYITEVYNALIFIEVKEGKNNALVRKFEEFVEDKEDFAYERYVFNYRVYKGWCCCYWRELTVITSVLNEDVLRKRKYLAAFPYLCCPERWSGLNRISHPDWVKICADRDTGSDVNVKSISYYKELIRKPETKSIKIRLISYTGDIIPITGNVYIIINRKGTLHELCFIITWRKFHLILGKDASEKLIKT